MNKDIRTLLYINSDVFRRNKVKLSDIPINNYVGQIPNIIFNNHNYIFTKFKIDVNHYILYIKEDEECVYIIISNKDKIAEIHTISNYKKVPRDTNQNVGFLLESIGFLLESNGRNLFNINMITLADNSIKSAVQ